MLAILVALPSLAQAAPQPKTDNVYGDIYMATAPDWRPWEISAGYETGLSNPYLSTNGLGLGARYTPRDTNWFVALDSTLYFTKLTGFAHDLERDFGDQGFETL